MTDSGEPMLGIIIGIILSIAIWTVVIGLWVILT